MRTLHPLSLRWPYPYFICKVHGVTFYAGIEHDDGDVRKWEHVAVFQHPNGTVEHIDIDWTPYQRMNAADCTRWLELGRPKRQGAGPLDARTLIEMEQRRAA